MWVYLTEGMVSIVEHYEDSNMLMVRARDRKVLEINFSQYPIQHSIHTDYAYRVIVPKKKCGEWLKKKVMHIDYPNFKDSITDSKYHKICSSTWYVSASSYLGLYGREL